MFAPCVVQAEFFHVSFETSLDGLKSECVERTQDGVRIKTVVRFRDAEGRVADCLHRYVESCKLKEKFFDELTHEQGLNYILARIRFTFVMKRYHKMRRLLPRYLVGCIEGAMKAGEDIAVEKGVHAFRLVRPDEKHELLEAIRRARHAWAFVFDDNHLLADKNTLQIQVF